jgi:hypothetical protein
MQILFLPSGNADSIILQFHDDLGSPINICIDSGYPKNYKTLLKKAFTAIVEKGEQIDLWVITHIDSDHIGGVIAFLKDSDFPTEFVKEFWFNPSLATIPNESPKITVEQGIQLRDYLVENGKCAVEPFLSDLSPIDLFGGRFTILSPNKPKFDAAVAKWDKEKKEKIGGFDYRQTIDELMKIPFKEDTSIWNGSSIAFLLELQGKRILFLADSHPSVVTENLRNKFGCSPLNPLKVDLVKISHHGSAGNTSPELLSLIECGHFVFCAYGKGYPAKSTLVRIAASRLGKKSPTIFLFNHPTPTYSEIFKHESEACEKLNFQFEYLPNGFLKL